MDVAQPNMAFSSLTLFECTISNATMLVESMSNKELLSAWRISGQLQSKIVEVLDPRVTELTESHDRLTELHSRCPPALLQPLDSDVAVVKEEPNVPEAKVPRLADHGVVCSSIECVKVKREEEDSESDCMILEEVCSCLVQCCDVGALFWRWRSFQPPM